MESQSTKKAHPMVKLLPAMGVTLVVVGAIGMGLLLFMLGSPADDEALDDRGKTVLATPVRHELSSTSQMGAVQRYDVQLRFTDEQGREQATTLETDHQSQSEAAESGTPIEIEYDPQDPTRARWSGSRLNPLGSFVYWIGGGVMLAGITLAGFGSFLRRSTRAA